MVPYNQRLQSYVSKSIDKLFRTIQFRQGVRRVIGTASLEDLSNVSGATPTDGEVLEWSQAQGLWIPGDGGGEGTIPNLQSVMGEGATYSGTNTFSMASAKSSIIDQGFNLAIGHSNGTGDQSLTTMAGSSLWNLSSGASGTAELVLDADASVKLNWKDGVAKSEILIDGTQMLVTDANNTKGLEYAGAYKANFTTYSLVDKDYVDTQIAAIPSGVTATSGAATEIAVFDGANSIAGDGSFTKNGGIVKLERNNGVYFNLSSAGSLGPRMDFIQSKGTLTSPTATTNGDKIGETNYFGYNGTTQKNAGVIRVEASETWSDVVGSQTNGSLMRFSTVTNGSTSLTEKYLIDGDGNHTFTGKLGIGTAPNSSRGLNLSTTAPYGGFFANAGTNASNYGVYGTATGAGSSKNIGGYFISTSNQSQNIGLAVEAGLGAVATFNNEVGVAIGVKGSVSGGKDAFGTLSNIIVDGAWTGGIVEGHKTTITSNIPGTVGTMRGANYILDATSGFINDMMGIDIDLTNSGATGNNAYGIKIQGIAGTWGGNKYAIYQTGPNDKNYFAGQLQLNYTAGTAGQFLKAIDTAGNAEWADVPAGGATSIGELSDAATPATDNVGLGSGALSSITTGDYNVAVGVNAGLGALGASRCVFIGNDAGRNVTGRSDCVAVGEGAMGVGTGGNTNIAVGANALSGVTGQGNVAVGNSAGSSITSGGFSLFLGRNAQGLNTQSYQIAIGTSVTTTQGYSLALGSSGKLLLHGEFATAGRTKLGVNLGNTYSAPTANLHVKGNASDTTTFLVQNGAGSSILQANQNGNIGIGTTAPQEKLHISTGNDLNSGDISFLIGGTAGTNARTGRIIKNTSSSYEMTIRASDFATGSNLLLNDTGGNVGIGTTSPAEALDISGNVKVGGQAYSATHTLTAAASVAPDFDNSNVQTVTLDQATTLANPTNLKDGATYIVIVKQPAGANHTLAFGTAYKFEGGTDPTITAANGATDVLTFVSDGTNLYGAAALNFS